MSGGRDTSFRGAGVLGGGEGPTASHMPSFRFGVGTAVNSSAWYSACSNPGVIACMCATLSHLGIHVCHCVSGVSCFI